ncbi:MAG: hypothetical protein ACK4G1_01720, partial [Ignavibacteria bacterium]
MVKHTLLISLILMIIFHPSSAQENLNSSEEYFKHNPGRLFSIQTADVNHSLDLSILIGGSFGLENSEGFLGSISFGLGGYGDIEVNTASLLGSIFSKTENFASIGLKIKALQETPRNPGITINLRTNNDWYTSNSSNIRKNSPELAEYGLVGISYDTRITHLIISLSKRMNEKFRVHLSTGIGDLRYKSLRSYFVDTVVIDDQEKKKNTFYFATGVDFELSEMTKLIFEGQTIPYFKVNPKTGLISPDLRKVFSGGLRVFVTRWLLLDSGF